MPLVSRAHPFPSAQAISIENQFDGSDGAIFVATVTQLMEQLPGWRTPLSAPEKRVIANPFTGALIPNLLTTDPGPRNRPALPRTLSFPCVRLPAREDWEQNYLALDLALSGDPPLTVTQWADDWLTIMLQRHLLEEPLFGGGDDIDDVRYLYRVPSRLVSRLVALQPDELVPMAQAWTRTCVEPPDAPAEYLTQFADLARLALATGGYLFSWNIIPLHRERSG